MRVKMRELRKSQGYTQESFAEAAGISRSHYMQIECGTKWPSVRTGMKIKKTLGYYDDDIYEDTPPIKK